MGQMGKRFLRDFTRASDAEVEAVAVPAADERITPARIQQAEDADREMVRRFDERKMADTEKVERVIAAGRQAFEDGKPIGANPHARGTFLRDGWALGWSEARGAAVEVSSEHRSVGLDGADFAVPGAPVTLAGDGREHIAVTDDTGRAFVIPVETLGHIASGRFDAGTAFGDEAPDIVRIAFTAWLRLLEGRRA